MTVEELEDEKNKELMFQYLNYGNLRGKGNYNRNTRSIEDE